MRESNRGTRARLLSSVGTAVFATLVAGGAQADSLGARTAIDQVGLPSVTATADLSINSPLTNNGSVGASVQDANGKIEQVGNQTGVGNVVSDNKIAAKAIGNTNQASIPALSSIAAEGAAILNTSINTPGLDDATGVVTSSVADSNLSIELEGFQTGSATNTGNTISADTTLNSATSSISGSVPSNYVSSAAGNSSLDYPDGAGDQFDARGTVVVSSVQQAIGTGQAAGSNASVTDNEIALRLTSTGDNTVASGPTVGDNTIAATFKGNSANNTADIQAGENPTFAGSAVVTNLQVNADGASDIDETAALNTGSTIGGSVSSEAFTNTLNGSLAVTGNKITSATTGNEALGSTTGTAGNSILLGDGMSIAGAGTPNSGANITYDGGGVVSNVAADLVIQNSQGNVATAGDQSLNSVTADATIGGDVESLNGGSINVSSNRIAAATTGNNASNAIATGEATGAFAASVAVANQQTNDHTHLGASNTNSQIGAIIGFGGAANADSVSVTGNTTAANAYGSQVSQSVALEANSVSLGASPVILTGGAGPQGHVVTSGAATVSNLQSRYDSSVTATNSDSDISLLSSAEDTTGSTLAVTSNTQEAVALGASASNALALSSGASMGSGAGIANVQIGDAGSPVSATLDSAIEAVNVSGDLGDEVGGSVSLTKNLQRAIGYGNSASNGLTVAGASAALTVADPGERASTVTFDPNASNGLVFDNSTVTAPTVTAAYGVLNDQSVRANVTASAGGEGGLAVSVGTDVQDSSRVVNDTNTFVAAAYGNDATSSVTVKPGQLDTGVDGGFASVANVTNVQSVGGAAAITAAATGGNVIRTNVGESVENSSVSTSGNAIQALAYGNRSTGNTVTVEGTNIDTAPALSDSVRGGATITGGQTLVTDAAFSVQNAQSAQGSVTATQRGATDAAQVRVAIGDGVSGSSIAADDNTSTASATSNSAVNALAIKATGLATTGAVQNLQTTSANMSALIGLAGTSPDLGGDFDYAIGGTGLSHDSETNTFTAGTLTIDTSSLDQAAVDYLVDDGWSVGGPNQLSRSAIGFSATAVDYLDLTLGGSFARTGIVPGTTGTPVQGGATVAIGGSISASSISLAGNSTSGSVTGNSAANSLIVTAANIENGSGLTASTAGVVGTDILENSIVGAAADHALSNIQAVESGSLTSNVYGAFAIDAAAGASISDATLSVSGNSQSASAVANTAANSLTVGDANTASISAGSALASLQSSDAVVASMSEVEVFAPAAVSNSTVNLSGNTNSSLGVINDVTNTLTVTGANIAPLDGAGNVQLTGGVVTGTAQGDHVLGNRQIADTSVTSTASTRLYNEDQIASATSGLVNSTVTIADNSTAAEASANRALNTLSINGGATQGANAGIANAQLSSAAVTANATTSATVTLAGTAGTPPPTPIPSTPALNGSSASISGNSTTALARGNTATNVLNATAGSSYGATFGGAGSTFTATPSVQAAAGVLNNQTNSGAVSASSVNVTYQIALNATPGNSAVTNGSVGVTGNQVATEAYGNSASNRVTLTALNTGSPTAAVGNYQLNTGAISATATSVSFGVTGVGTVGASSLRATGNQVTATAVGNSAVSTITAAR